jgi:peptide-methionine (R)-S-oxide reductase
MTYPIQKTEAEWQALLAEKGAEPAAFQVTRHAATERPFTGKYEAFWADGSYHCVCCGAKLFQAVPGAIKEIRDVSHGMVRTETVCAQCGAHLGHVFPDGPSETGLRYCMNSASLQFEGDKK